MFLIRARSFAQLSPLFINDICYRRGYSKDLLFMRYNVDELWIDEEVLAEPLTGEIVKKLPDARVLIGEEFGY